MAMATSGAGGSGGRRRRGARKHRPIADINMTPFIDVMLVLLIIFMVAAPMLTTGVPLDLPQTGAAALNVEKQPLVISIKADGKIYLMETETSLPELVSKLKSVSKTGPEERIFVRGDAAIAYGKVAEVMAALSSAGYKKVALVNAPTGN
jgi:biopolymer transport protein TolR